MKLELIFVTIRRTDNLTERQYPFKSTEYIQQSSEIQIQNSDQNGWWKGYRRLPNFPTLRNRKYFDVCLTLHCYRPLSTMILCDMRGEASENLFRRKRQRGKVSGKSDGGTTRYLKCLYFFWPRLLMKWIPRKYRLIVRQVCILCTDIGQYFRGIVPTCTESIGFLDYNKTKNSTNKME